MRGCSEATKRKDLDVIVVAAGKPKHRELRLLEQGLALLQENLEQDQHTLKESARRRRSSRSAPAKRLSARTAPDTAKNGAGSGAAAGSAGHCANHRKESHVFEIGSSLREARMRRKLELSQIEQDTRIRAKYLTALEDDRFDALPGVAYARGFLRTYADYLGLDAQRFVDEYNTHFAPEEEPAAPPPVRIRPRRLGFDSWLLAVPVAAVLVGLIAWQLSSTGSHHHAAFRPPSPTTHTTTPAPTPAPQTVKHTATVARIVLAASRGPCWLSVHIGSATGPSVFERTLQPGQTARFVSTRLWIRVGAPWNVDATLNGNSVQLPASTASVVVTSTGMSVVG